MSSSASSFDHVESFRLFPKKTVGGNIGEYNRVQSLFLDDDTYTGSLANMLFLDSKNENKKSVARALNAVLRENYPDKNINIRHTDVDLRSSNLWVDSRVTFEPGYDWSLQINYKEAVKSYVLSVESPIRKRLDKLRTKGKVPFTTGNVIVEYLDIKDVYICNCYGRSVTPIDGVVYSDSFPENIDTTFRIFVNIFPTLVDYASVLKKMRSQIQLTNINPYHSSDACVLLVGSIRSKNIDSAHVEKIIDSASISLVTEKELDDFVSSNA
jgi:hypothetical protein